MAGPTMPVLDWQPCDGGFQCATAKVPLNYADGVDVVIVTYGCHVLSADPPLVSNEHKRAGLCTFGEIPDLIMPDGYRRSIAAWPPARP